MTAPGFYGRNGVNDMSDIQEKIKKLQALADNAGTEHEAALAAQLVADLCRKHNLDIGSIELEKQETEASESVRGLGAKLWNAHWSSLSVACNDLFGTSHYRKTIVRSVRNDQGFVVRTESECALVFYGLKANVDAASMTFSYLLASVESMLEGYISEGHALDRSGIRAFRMGCANRIMHEAAKLAQLSKNLLAGNSEVTALVQIENQLIAAHKKKMGLRAGTRAHGPSDSSAFNAGYRAGGRVDIHGARSSRMLR